MKILVKKGEEMYLGFNDLLFQSIKLHNLEIFINDTAPYTTRSTPFTQTHTHLAKSKSKSLILI